MPQILEAEETCVCVCVWFDVRALGHQSSAAILFRAGHYGNII